MTADHLDRSRAGVIALAAVVLSWRAAAWASALAGFGGAASTPAGIALSAALNSMGAAFLLIGVVTFWRLGSRSARLFAVYAAAAGMHWGGPISLAQAELQTAVTLTYLVLSSIASSSLLLHFALAFTERAVGPRTLLFLYLPIPLAVLTALALLAAPDPSGFRDGARNAFFAVYMAQTNLYPLLAIVALAVRYFRRSDVDRGKTGVGAALLATSVPAAVYLVAELANALAPGALDIAGLGTEPLNLFTLVEPIGFAYALHLRGQLVARG